MTSLTTVAESVRDTVRTTVSDVETKVVDAVRDLQAPVTEYVQKGISFAGDHLPDYPSNLPTPSELVDTQYDVVTTLLAEQYDKARAVAAKVAPLVGVTVDEPTGPATSSKSSKSSTSSTSSASTKATKATRSTGKAS